jgi:hypothetical protein
VEDGPQPLPRGLSEAGGQDEDRCGGDLGDETPTKGGRSHQVGEPVSLDQVLGAFLGEEEGTLDGSDSGEPRPPARVVALQPGPGENAHCCSRSQASCRPEPPAGHVAMGVLAGQPVTGAVTQQDSERQESSDDDP